MNTSCRIVRRIKKRLEKKYFLVVLAMLMASIGGFAQTYSNGVSKPLKNAILDTDSSTYKSIRYEGRGTETMFDRRVNGNIAVNAYLFTVTWNNGSTCKVIVNPEIGDKDEVTAQAIKHGRIVGRLPFCLRNLIDNIRIHGGNAPYGGGNRGMLFYVQKTLEHETIGDLNEIVVHEAGHNLGNVIAYTQSWKTAQNKDGVFISGYAQKYPTREDVSESFLAWLIVRYYSDRISQQDKEDIEKQIPARLTYFDNQDYNVYPITRR